MLGLHASLTLQGPARMTNKTTVQSVTPVPQQHGLGVSDQRHTAVNDSLGASLKVHWQLATVHYHLVHGNWPLHTAT